MKKRLIFFVFFSAVCTVTSAQLIINSGLSPQQLANRIAGPGINVYNAAFTGDPTMGGIFTAANTNLGINSGVMLATGDVSFAIGPNLVDNNGNDMQLPGDPILDGLANAQTFDACILEFDFVPQSSIVTFRYIFGSEEYPEYVCSIYNDVFAFFISGPGITGSLNMALIPGTSIPVAINSVNGGAVGSNGSPGSHCGLGYSNLYVDNTAGPTIEMDGFTTPMVATALVQPCQMYHMRIMIADASDGAFDSGVFIEEGSLFSNPVVNAGTDQSICSGNTVQIGISPAPGYTYNWSPVTGLSSLTSSDPTVTLTNTGISPITITYVVVANSGTCLFNDTVVITVNPSPMVSFTASPSQVCINQPITIDYTGTAATNYTWNFGSATVISGSGSGPYVISFPASGQNLISVTASSPGCSGSFDQSVNIDPFPVPAFSMPANACPGEQVPINFTGIASVNAIYTWDFGGGQVVSGSGSGPYIITWANTGFPTVSLSILDNACASPVEINQINVEQLPVFYAGSDTSLCPNSTVLLGGTGTPGYSYSWSPAIGLDNPFISNPSATVLNPGNNPLTSNYIVTVTSPGGCSASDDVNITAIPAVNVTFSVPIGKCMDGNSFDFTVQGTYPAGSVFSWDFGAQANPSVSSNAIQTGVTFSSVGTHTVTLNATSGTCSMQPVSHSLEIYPMPVVDFMTNDLEGCSPLLLNLQNLSADFTHSFSWSLSEGSTSTITEPVLSISTPGLHDVTLTATSQFGCSSTFTKQRYITVYATPVSSFITQPAIASIEAPIIFFQNNSLNAQNYIWDFGDSTSDYSESISHTYQATGIYNIILIAFNNGGCADTAYGKIEINEGLQFFIPNSFTPDDDGINDFFQGYGINIHSYKMSIYNRWGEKIYETTDYNIPWDGRIKSMVQNDVYVYKISVTDKMEGIHDYTGSVTVIK